MARCQMHGADPGAFRQTASGLFVPEEHSRYRDVITADEWKLLSRTIRSVMAPHWMKFQLICEKDDCTEPRIERIRQPTGGFILRCGCRDRVYNLGV